VLQLCGREALELSDRPTLCVQVDGSTEHLDDRVVLQLLDGLLHPVVVAEADVCVHPSHVLPVAGEPSNSSVDYSFFVPELIPDPKLEVLVLDVIPHLVGALAKRGLSDVDDGSRCLRSLPELAEEVVAGQEPHRIEAHSHHM